MQALVARMEMSLDAARLVEGHMAGLVAQVEQRLTGTVPEHTKAALETQLENAREAQRVLESAIASPAEVEVPDPPTFSS